MHSPPPLTGLKVVELAGLAPGPFAGMLLADYGATVLRVDRPNPRAHQSNSKPVPPTPDLLTRHKRSVAVSLKDPRGLALLKSLIPHIDILIDPFRPGVLENLGLSPQKVLLSLNPRLVIARLTGYRRDGKYASMAGHDINYLAVSGVLSMLGPPHDPNSPPIPPANILGDFAGGGAACFQGILLALLHRERMGKGQVVESNMVDGVAYLATFPRLLTKKPGSSGWADDRGTNLLDGGAPFYACYQTKDGKFVSVGALEPHFFEELMRGLNLNNIDWGGGDRIDKASWPRMKDLFRQKFLEKTRKDWEEVFDGTDACVAPVKTQRELEAEGFDQRQMVTLKDPSAVIVEDSDRRRRPPSQDPNPGEIGDGWVSQGLAPGEGGEDVLLEWVEWKKGRDIGVNDGGLVLLEKRARL